MFAKHKTRWSVSLCLLFKADQCFADSQKAPSLTQPAAAAACSISGTSVSRLLQRLGSTSLWELHCGIHTGKTNHLQVIP